MLTMKTWFSILLVLAIMAVPVVAENNDAKTANDNAASATSAEGSPAAANPAPNPTPNPSISPISSNGDANVTALLGVLVMKGVLAPAEANAIRNAAPTAQFQALVEVLSRKGLVSADDLSAATHATPQPSAISVVRIPEGMSTSRANTESEPSPQAKPAPQAMQEMKPTAAAVIPAVAPVRVFPVDPPKAGGLSGLKVGPITIAPYGFVKATVVHDSSDPDGDDFPFPGIWLNAASATNTGPTQDPEFHVKARSTRLGRTSEWPTYRRS